jgi:hypothetical protein
MRSFVLIAFGLILGSPASAQVAGFRSATPIADQHRYETDRLRQLSDQRAIEARQQSLNSRLTRLELQSRRQSAPISADPAVTGLSLDQARAARETATARREAIVEGVTGIDTWLDRPRN